jgi:hypothetical protein
MDDDALKGADLARDVNSGHLRFSSTPLARMYSIRAEGRNGAAKPCPPALRDAQAKECIYI